MTSHCARRRIPTVAGTLLLTGFSLAGCSSILIVQPRNGTTVPYPGSVTAQVSVRGRACNGSFQAILDGRNVTSLFSPQPPVSANPQAIFPSLVPGDHTLMVSVRTGFNCSPLSATSTFFRVGAPSIYITDGESAVLKNDRIVQIGDMTGSGWTSFGSPGAGTNQFVFPRGIYVYSPTRIYTVDEANHRIVLMMDMQGAGWTALGSQGGGPRQFADPVGISLDLAMKIYVTDAGTNQIDRMDDMTGANWTTFGSTGAGINQFHAPAGIVVDGNGRIYVADSANDRIVRINDMSGNGWITLGSTGSGVRQFSNPAFLALDQQGRIYVTDSNNCRVVRIDDITGASWTSLGGVCGSGFGQFNGVRNAQMGGIFVDTGGKIYVADGGNSRLVRMDDMSGAGWTVLGTFGNGTKQFSVINSIFVKPPALLVPPPK
jgi:sugar lactone lactonase YvrE